jgi:hypothetical protein
MAKKGSTRSFREGFHIRDQPEARIDSFLIRDQTDGRREIWTKFVLPQIHCFTSLYVKM